VLENEAVTASHLLVIEDDPEIAHLLQLDLQDAGYRVSHASGRMSGLTKFREEVADLVLLDLGLPDGKGHDVSKRIRQHSAVPIIILKAQGDLDSKVELLGQGADYYLIKPFNHLELLARIAVQLRRFASAAVRFGALEISAVQRLVKYTGEVVPLSSTEFQIMQALLGQPGQLHSKETLFAEV